MIRTQETFPIYPYPTRLNRSTTRKIWNGNLVIQILVVIILTGVILPAGLLAGVGLVYETQKLILPGVSTTNLDLSGLTREQAIQVLNETWNVGHRMTIMSGNRSWQVTPVELGLFLDPSATAQAAFQVARSSLTIRLRQILRREPQILLPVIGYRPELARETITRISNELYQAPQEASAKFEQGQWIAAPGKAGLEVDVDATLARISADPMGVFFKSRIELVTKPVSPQVTDLSGVVEKLQASIQKPFLIKVYDPVQDETLDWSLSPEALASWVVVNNPSSLEPVISLDPAHLSAYLQKKSASLAPLRTLETYQPPSNLTQFWQEGKTLQLMARHLPTTYTVEAGDTLWNIARKVEVQYWMILKANPGVSDATLRKGQVLQIPSKDDMLPLPVVMGKRIVISISQQHMWTYENGKLRKDYVISTGIPSSPTMPGVYQVQSHIENAYAENWDLWMPNFLGIYQAVPGFWNGIHGLPIMSNGVRLWANVLGQPITYGCILMDLKDGQDVYNWAEEGVVVEIDP
jgi:LysM repeat protein